MKGSVPILISVALSATLPAFAGPDWRAIEGARTNHRAQVARMDKLTPDEKCAARRVVLRLGEQAQVTPDLDEKRKASFEAELKACKEAAAIGNAR